MDSEDELRTRRILSALLTEKFEEHGITRVRLAPRVGISLISLGRYLDGHRTAPLDVIRAFCRALRIDVVQFWVELEERLDQDEQGPKV